MQKWEHCELVMDAYSAKYFLIFYSANNRTSVTIQRDKSKGDSSHGDARRRIIAEVGFQGWEMVGSSVTNVRIESLYFKRPLP